MVPKVEAVPFLFTIALTPVRSAPVRVMVKLVVVAFETVLALVNK